MNHPEPPVSPATTTFAHRDVRPAPLRWDGPRQMPRWQVLLHDDEVNEMGEVCDILCEETPLRLGSAFAVMLKAHREGISAVYETHREYGELMALRLRQRGLLVTLQPC